MSKVLEMIEKRNVAWNAAKTFVEERQDKDGLLSDEDAKIYKEMEDKVKNYGIEIERLKDMELLDKELSLPTTNAIKEKPESGKYKLQL